MTTERYTKPLAETIEKALSFQSKDMISRTQWGSINFKNASADLDQIFITISHLQVLPLEYLTDQAATQIKQYLDGVVSQLDAIDKFNIEQGNPIQVRDSLVSGLHQHAEQFYTMAGPWIPVLAYQKGDVAKNIEALTQSVQDARTIVEKARVDIEIKHREIETIIMRAREASAAAGAAVGMCQ